MIKTCYRFFFVIILIFIIASQFPVSLADQYGTIQGKTIDKNGNGITGVNLTLQNGDYKIIANTLTGSDGSYAFNQVPVPNGNDIYRIVAKFDRDSIHYDGGTAFFNVMQMQITSQDVYFNDYPPSGIGALYGVVSSDSNMITLEKATVYLDNGMYFLYAGDRYDTWSFEKLPQGKYVLWAECNIGNVTYTSIKYNVTVTTDDRAYMPVYLPVYFSGTNKITYHEQPVQMKNVVHGTIIQSNGVPYTGAKVELLRTTSGTPELIASTSSNDSGQYLFDNVKVDTISDTYHVRVTVTMNGVSHTQSSSSFNVYFANTLNVPHDANVPFSLGFVNSGSALIQSTPAGARLFVDGVDIHKTTPYNLTGLPAGSHTIGLLMDDYLNDNFTLQIEANASITVNRTLKPGTGSTYLDVVPSGAAVYIDGKYAGVSPVNLTKYSAGPHSYLIACDGFRNESGTINIVPGEVVTKRIGLVATPGFSLTYIGYLIGSMLNAISSIF